MANPYYKPRAPKPCPTCGEHFEKAKKQEVYCSLRCAITPKIDQRGPDECWPWTGGLVMGYGAGTFQKRRYKASRWVLEQKLGKPLGELQALHSCDNPKCCNPAHLFPGTGQDNMTDKMLKGRCRNKPSDRKGEQHHKAKLTAEQVKFIWSQRYTGSAAEIARQFGMQRGAVWRIMKGKAWQSITDALP